MKNVHEVYPKKGENYGKNYRLETPQEECHKWDTNGACQKWEEKESQVVRGKFCIKECV